MNAGRRTFLMGLLGCLSLFSAQAARADSDTEICQGGYRVLLMTPGECRAYLYDLHAAQARAEHETALDLQEWHTALLFERSQSCPCHSGADAGRPGRGAAQVASSGKP